MTLTLFTALLLTIASATLAGGRVPRRVAQPAPQIGNSPLDHAARILAERHERGEISFEQYQRMLTVLQH